MSSALSTKTHTLGPATLTAPSNTDIWRKPPSHNVFNAPTYPPTLPMYPLSTFHRARVTFTLPAALALKQYDQAGILLHFHSGKAAQDDSKDSWIKTGIEFYNGQAYVATVGCDTFADWSLVPVASFAGGDARLSATIEVCRESDGLGRSLWIYHITRNDAGEEQRMPVREITWALRSEEGEVGIGAYCCRPAKEEGMLEVQIGEVVVEVVEE